MPVLEPRTVAALQRALTQHLDDGTTAALRGAIAEARLHVAAADARSLADTLREIITTLPAVQGLTESERSQRIGLLIEACLEAYYFGS